MTTPVELVRGIYADWARGDFDRIDWAHPDIEYVHGDGLETGAWRGIAGMRRAFAGFLSPWQDWRVEAEDVLEAEGGRVIALFRFYGRGKTSGLDLGEMATKGANVFHVRDGKVVRLVQYFDRERALTDVGLAGDRPHEPARSDHIATVSALFDEFARREDDLAFQVFDDEIAWDARSVPLAELGVVFRGHDGVRSFWRTWLEAWESIEWVGGPHHRAHGNQVISWWRQRNRGKDSGVPVERELSLVWTFEGDRIVRVAVFWSRVEAFEASGLDP